MNRRRQSFIPAVKRATQNIGIGICRLLLCYGSVALIIAAYEPVIKQIGTKTAEDKVLLVITLSGLFYFVARDAAHKAKEWGLLPNQRT